MFDAFYKTCYKKFNATHFSKKKKLLRNIFRLLIEVSKFFSSLYENYQMYDGKLKSIRDKPNTVKHKLVSLTVDWMTVN